MYDMAACVAPTTSHSPRFNSHANVRCYQVATRNLLCKENGEGTSAIPSNAALVETLARAVLQRCLALGSRDNMTIVLADLRPPEPPPEVRGVDETSTPGGEGHATDIPVEGGQSAVPGVGGAGKRGREGSGSTGSGVGGVGVGGAVVDSGRGDEQHVLGLCLTGGVDKGTSLSGLCGGTGVCEGEAAAWERGSVEVREGVERRSGPMLVKGERVHAKLDGGVHVRGDKGASAETKGVRVFDNASVAVTIGAVASAVAEVQDADLALGVNKSANGVVGKITDTRQGDANGIDGTCLLEHNGGQFRPPESVGGFGENGASAE